MSVCVCVFVCVCVCVCGCVCVCVCAERPTCDFKLPIVPSLVEDWNKSLSLCNSRADTDSLSSTSSDLCSSTVLSRRSWCASERLCSIFNKSISSFMDWIVESLVCWNEEC